MLISFGIDVVYPLQISIVCFWLFFVFCFFFWGFWPSSPSFVIISPRFLINFLELPLDVCPLSLLIKKKNQNLIYIFSTFGYSWCLSSSTDHIFFLNIWLLFNYFSKVKKRVKRPIFVLDKFCMGQVSPQQIKISNLIPYRIKWDNLVFLSIFFSNQFFPSHFDSWLGIYGSSVVLHTTMCIV